MVKPAPSVVGGGGGGGGRWPRSSPWPCAASSSYLRTLPRTTIKQRACFHFFNTPKVTWCSSYIIINAMARSNVLAELVWTRGETNIEFRRRKNSCPTERTRTNVSSRFPSLRYVVKDRRCVACKLRLHSFEHFKPLATLAVVAVCLFVLCCV